ncbi:MAG: ribosome-associated protein [Motiliproteus sp.]|jgi:ribosome-associated protein
MSDRFNDLEKIDETVKSKTQIKREVEALQKLGMKLINQKQELLDKLPLNDELRAALREALRLKQNEAKRRHMQYIGKLMRDVDPDLIQQAIDTQDAGTPAYAQYFHNLERWRDRLIADDDQIDNFAQTYPEADRQHLRQLLRNARKETELGKLPVNAKKLFKYIRELDKNSQ